MATRRLGPPGGEDSPEHATQRLPRLARRCLACHGEMLPLAYWTSAEDRGWGDLRFGPRHPGAIPVPVIMPPLPDPPPMWEGGRGMVLPPPPPLPTGPVDLAPEVSVEAFACADCGRLDWYVVGPRPGHEGGMR